MRSVITCRPGGTTIAGVVGVVVWVLVGVALGVALGVATSYLQGVLPGAWNRLANSGAVWSVVAWVAAVVVARTRIASVLTTTGCLLGAVAGYYVLASPWRGIATSSDERVLWTTVALVVGIPLGFAADAWSRGTPAQRALGGSAVSALVLLEGLHAVLSIASDDPAGRTEIVLGVAGMLASWLTATRTRRRVRT